MFNFNSILLNASVSSINLKKWPLAFQSYLINNKLTKLRITNRTAVPCIIKLQRYMGRQCVSLCSNCNLIRLYKLIVYLNYYINKIATRRSLILTATFTNAFFDLSSTARSSLCFNRQHAAKLRYVTLYRSFIRLCSTTRLLIIVRNTTLVSFKIDCHIQGFQNRVVY